MRLSGRWMVVVTVVLFGLSGLAARAARQTQEHSVENTIRYLPQPEVMRIASFGYDELVADALWLKLILYYGESRKGQHSLAFFEQLAETIITLDPLFVEGYRFPALVISQDMGNPQEGIAFLEKGMRAMPEEWWLPFEAGFIEYVTCVDDEEAFHWFKRAADVPNAPEFPRRFAAFVSGRAGDLQVSLVLYRTLAETTSDKYQREDALRKVKELEAAIRGDGPIPEWIKRRRYADGKVDPGIQSLEELERRRKERKARSREGGDGA